jgi:hypothetical protein
MSGNFNEVIAECVDLLMPLVTLEMEKQYKSFFEV